MELRHAVTVGASCVLAALAACGPASTAAGPRTTFTKVDLNPATAESDFAVPAVVPERSL